MSANHTRFVAKSNYNRMFSKSLDKSLRERAMKISGIKTILFAAAAIAASCAAQADVGRTRGLPGVSPSGAATYRIPIWTPPGPGGVAPQISLNYGSQGANGIVGVGWTLGGISEIERCSQTVAQDGAAREVKLDANDKYCLDGVRLRLTSPGIGYGLAGSTYQTEIADFSEIKAVGPGFGSGPSSFERRMKDGLTYYYGSGTNTLSGLVGAQGAPSPHRWKMDKVSDRFGNNYVIDYSDQDAAGHKHPWKIRWRPDASGSSTYVYLMEFLYETKDNPDSLAGYLGGFVTYDKNRLKTILVKRVSAGTETVLRRYSLEYTKASTNLSRLSKVTECVDLTDDHCLSPTVLDYQGGSGVLAFRSSNTPSVASIEGIADFNGDGKDDIAFIANGQWKVLFGANGALASPVAVTGLVQATQPTQAVEIDRFMPDGRAAFLANVNGILTTFSATDANNDGVWEFNGGVSTGIVSPTQTAPQAIDYNGDGLADLVWVVYNGSSQGGSTIRQLHGRLNTTVTGSASATFGPEIAGTNLPATPPSGGFVAGMTMWSRNTSHADVNGDGREDMFVLLVGRNGTTISYYNVLFQSPTEFSPPSSWTNGFIPNVMVGDFNNDHCSDLYNGAVSLSKCAVLIPTQITLPAGVVTNVPTTNIMGWGDWDGDGRSDLFVKNGTNLGVYPSTGSGFGPIQTTAIPSGTGSYFAPGYFFLDLDGDNVVDLARVNGGTIEYYTRANGTGAAILYTTHLPDLLASVTDGNGFNTSFDYVSTAQNNYLPGSPAVSPLKPIADAMIVVGQMRQSDGIGGTFSRKYTYTGARDDSTRGSFAGFEEIDELDSRTNFTTKTVYEQMQPKLGMIKSIEVAQASGRPVSRTTYTNLPQELSGNSSNNQRYFQFVSQILEEQFDLAGPVSGASAMTSILTKKENVDYANGNVEKITQILTDGDSSATSLDSGKVFTTTTTNLFETNSGNWCLGLVKRSQIDRSSSSDPATISVVKSFTPDIPNCRPSHEIIETVNGKYDIDTLIGYDTFGNPKTLTVSGKNSDGTAMAPRVTTFTTDATGTFVEKIENAAHEISLIGHNESGLIASTTDPNLLVTSYGYDGFGRQQKITRPDGTAVEFNYTDCTPSCLPTQHRTTLTVNELNSGSATPRSSRVTYLDRMDRPIVERKTLVDGKQQWLETIYTNRGLVEKRSLPCATIAAATSCAASWLESRYDDFGRLIEFKRPPSGGGSPPTYTYTFNGRKTTITDPLLNQRSVISGVDGQIRRSQDANLYSQTFSYDLAGSLTGVIDSSGRTLASATYVYGLAPFQRSTFNPAAGTVHHDFNSFGDMTSWDDALGTTFTADYDAVSRRISQTEIDNIITFTWGADTASHNVGMLKAMTSTAGGAYSSTNYYDAFARLQYRDYVIPGDATYRYEYAYDPATGLLDTLTYPTSTPGNRLSLKYGYTNDSLSSIGVAGTSQTVWSAVAANIRGQLTDEKIGEGIVLPNPILRTQTFDPITGWPDTYKAGTSTGTTSFEDGRVFLDAIGNVTQRQNNKTMISENFIYGNASDHVYRLDHSEIVGGPSPGRNLTLTYDNIGNVQTKDEPQVVDHPVAYTITWNRANYPKHIDAGGEVADFAYGPQRQRWKMVFTSGGVLETTFYIGGLMEKVVEGPTTSYRHYIQTPGGATSLFTRTSSSTKWTFLLPDHLGSIDAIIDGSGGAPIWTSFRAYGERRNASTWSGEVTAAERATLEDISRVGFTSQTMLGMTGFIHMNGRVYDAISARFLSPDPIVADPTNTQTFNRYSYVFNNPLSFTDPTGFEGGGSPTPWIEDCVWWRIKISGDCVDRPFDGPTFTPTGFPMYPYYHGPKNTGGTSDSSDSNGLIFFASRYLHYGMEYLTGALDSTLKQLYEQPQFDDIGDAHPSMEEMSGAPYQSPFHPPADSEDQLMRDLGPTLPVVAAAATGRGVGGVAPRAAAETEELVDLASAERRTHVLDGEARANGSYGGGHRAGTGYPNKSEFPASWSDDKIMHEISDVATDPRSVVRAQRGEDVFLRGTRDGVEIEVLVRKGQIWTGYPVNAPRNP